MMSYEYNTLCHGIEVLIQMLHLITLKLYFAFHQMHYIGHMSQINHHNKSLSDFFIYS